MSDLEELLKQAWETEILGKELFSALAELLPEDRRMWELIALLETTMSSLVERVATAHGVEADTATVAAIAGGFATASKASGRDEVLKSSMDFASQLLPLYDELALLLPADQAWLAADLTAHELAFNEYVEATLTGRPDGEAAIIEFLSRHGVTVPIRRLELAE